MGISVTGITKIKLLSLVTIKLGTTYTHDFTYLLSQYLTNIYKISIFI